ncbi:hypothetical protein Ancab_029120 [Ancistrocladus abbreviatus]
MPCSKEALATLFLNLTSTFKLLFLFFYFSSSLLSNLFSSLCCRNRNEYYDEMFNYDDEDEEVQEEEAAAESYRYTRVEQQAEREDLVADIRDGGEELVFWHRNLHQSSSDHEKMGHKHSNSYYEEPYESFDEEPFSSNGSLIADFEEISMVAEEDNPRRDSDSGDTVYQSNTAMPAESPAVAIGLNKYGSDLTNHRTFCAEKGDKDIGDSNNMEGETMFGRDDKFLIFSPPKMEAKKFNVDLMKEGEVFGDSATVGSTSKSSSEWRSSMTCRDSGTDDPFSSSSRRSCPKWESYTVFQKYDEEMIFLDRISAQKLHETESLRSFKVQPRSVSERIVHKFSTTKKKPSDELHHRNANYVLEAAYVAQICLTWEALNCNYYNFQRKRASRRQEATTFDDKDLGCPANIAQQFQQFQVLLQRYIENEPYEYGRRPQVYARMRSIAPKLLLVPEYQDDDEDDKEELPSSRISSVSFVMIIEEAIQTFMKFLKADRETHCQILASLFRRRHQKAINPAFLHTLKKTNKKKKTKLKDLERAGKCLRKRKITKEEEMEILMGLIDLKVVSRVLRMTEITQQQLQWCAEKMGKLRISEGRLRRDSSPLFFPAHNSMLL